jgi:hypothetical protein
VMSRPFDGKYPWFASVFMPGQGPRAMGLCCQYGGPSAGVRFRSPSLGPGAVHGLGTQVELALTLTRAGKAMADARVAEKLRTEETFIMLGVDAKNGAMRLEAL